mmetsp:Transcript_19462/g.29930  ORF Transcript_19462/g.29930 Transcript_19462/m.29930 type:complete len:278 (-) Transcript_19462:7-840(-)
MFDIEVLSFTVGTAQDVSRDQIQTMEWTNNQKYLIAGDKIGNVLYINRVINKDNMFVAHPESCIRGLSLSMSSIKFVTCSDDRTARVWDLATSKNEVEFKEHNQSVWTCDWHPFQSLVLTGSKDMSVRVWDPRNNTSKSIFQVKKHTAIVQTVKWNPINGIYFLSGSMDKKIKLFDLRNMKEEVRDFDGPLGTIQDIKWHPFKEEVFASACSNGNICYWYQNHGRLHEIRNAHKDSVQSIDFSPNGTMLASVGKDQKAKFWGLCKPYEDLILQPRAI